MNGRLRAHASQDTIFTLTDPKTDRSALSHLALAHQTIYHDGRYPSHILLPVIPDEV